MAETKNNDEQFPEVKPTKPGNDTAYIAPIIGKLGYDTRRPWLFGLGTSPNNGVDFHVFLSFDGLNFDDNDIDKIWNGGTADKVKKEVDSATAEIPAAVSAANSAVSAAESAVAASKVNSDAIAAQSEAISEVKSAMDSATAEIQQTAANAASDAAKIRADVAQVQSEVDTAKAANSASVEALKSDVSAAKQDLADVHDSLTKAQSAIEQNQKAINDSIAEINANVDATNQDLAGVRKDLTKAQSDIIANQKAVNDNVAQINSDIEQDRKDIASAQQANADTVKQLDAYSKQAQEQGKTIKAVQDKQDGFSATLADVQGNVSQVSDKVDGLSASLKDAQGNVASVKAQADQLSATLTDHAKSIATLTASAKELSSTLEDADGRLSKVEQTAKTNSSTLSDVQGDLSQVKQDATTLTSTLKDTQGNISTLQQKADSVSAQLASAQGDIATLQTGIDSVKATLASHDKTIHTLQLDSKSLKDSMADAQGDISTLSKTATSLDSEMKDHAGRLSKVEQTAKEHTSTISDLGDKLSNLKVGGRNLLHGTSDQWRTLTGSGWLSSSTASDVYTPVSDYHNGDQFTYSAIITNNSKVPVRLVLYCYGADKRTKLKTVLGQPVNPGAQSTTITNMISVDGKTPFLRNSIETLDGKAPVFSIQVKGEKLEAGNKATAWTPNPDDMATLTQVKQTADGIETTLKSAQGDIDQIKQTAKGTSEQLSNVQGNVTNIQKDVDGLKQTTADNAGNIHTLQSDSKTLKDDMQDAQGDISTLKKTSTDVTSELKDHAGRISKTEQTASTLVNEFADQQGHLNRVEQTAQGTQQTVANQQGQINNIKTDAAGIHETLTGQGNQIANINVTLSGLNSKYEGVSGDLGKLKSQAQWITVTSAVDLNNVKTPCHEFLKGTVTNAPNETAWWYLTVESSDDGNRVTQTVIADQSNNRYTRRWADAWSAWVKDATQTDVTALSNRITTNSTQITQNKQAIALKADQSTVNNLTGEVSQNKAQLKIQADQISSKVSSTDFTALNGRTMQNRGTVNSPDFNSLTQAGYYTVTMPINGKNYPTGSWGTLEVSGQVSDANGRLNQKYVSDNNGTAYIRQYNATTKSWTAWVKEANQYDIDTLSGKITKNSTDIDQTNQQISLKADQTEVDQVKQTATQNSSRLDVMAGQISSKVTATDVNNIVDSKGYATTSTVQSLITQKAGTINESITNLTNKVNSNNGGGVNFLQGTAKIEFPLYNNGGTQTIQKYDDETNYIQHTSNTPLNGMGPWWPFTPEVGKTYTLSADVCGNGYIPGGMFHYEGADEGSLGRVDLTNDWQRISNTFRVNTISGNWVIYANNSTLLKVKHIKIERGSVATPWTPAPSDNATVTQVQQITASIDGIQSTVANKADKSQITQLSNMIQSKVSSSDFNALKDEATWKSTDSIDLNNAVSQQKIFVKGGSNLPPGDYWWYVQVEPGYDSRIVQYAVSDRDNIHYSRQYDGSKWSTWSQGATESEITQLRDDINLRVKSGDLLSQINLTAHNTLIQSGKIYLDSSSTVFSGKAFIPSAAIVSLDANKINTGTLNTQMVSIGDDQTRLWARSNYLYLTGKEQGDAYNMRIGGDKIEFVTTEIPNNAPYLDGITPMYSIEYNGDAKARLKVRSFNRLTGSNEFPVEMYDSVNISKDELDFAANNQMKMQVVDGGVNVRPTLFLQNNTNNGTWAGFTRLDNSDTVEFNTGNNNGENFHVNSGARFMQYVYINGYARAQQWLTNSALSKKMNIRKLDLQMALDKIRQDDQYLYEYKRNVAQGIHDPQASFIIDDVHDVAHYSVPREFIDQTGKYREPNVELAYLIAAFQAIDKQVQAQQSEIKALKEQLQHE